MSGLSLPLRTAVKRLARSLPGLGDILARRDQARQAPQFVPPGHFYSPIPSLDDIKRDHSRLFAVPPRSLPGIELNESRQLELLETFKSYYTDLPFTEHKTTGYRYFYENTYYSYSDAIFLYCMIRHLKPRRIIEVGSGYSSCAILDTNHRFLGGTIRCTFVEPYPDRLLSLLEEGDRSRIEIIQQRLQDVPLDRFKELNSHDMLFIDSTHVSKIGSDVNYILGDLLPSLNPGVYIHFHDVFYPFEYPPDWIYAGRNWTEAYLLRAFLAFNRTFEIVFFNTFLERFHRDTFLRHMPLCLRNEGGSIWLRRATVAG